MLWTTKHGWLGVDIGTAAIKVAQVVRRGGQFRLADCAVVRRREPWPTTSLSGPQTSAAEIRAALSMGRQFRGRHAASAVTMALCELLSLETSEYEDSRLRELVGKEVAARAATDATRRAFDFWHMNPDPNARGENISGLSVPVAWVDQVADDVTKIGLWCQVLDGAPLAVSRATGIANAPTTSGPLAALDWGYSHATFCAVSEGSARYVRCLRDGGLRHLVAALADELGVNDEEAQHLLTRHGLPATTDHTTSDSVQPLLAEILTSALTNIRHEINRTLDFLQTHRREIVPRQLVLFGGGATIRNIDSHLTAHLELPVVKWKGIGRDTIGSPTFSSDDAAVSLFGPAVALSCLRWETA